MGVPSGSVPEASMTAPANRSRSRHFPVASKFSSARPSGSITAWQAAQVAFARCFAIISRTVRARVVPMSFSSSVGTLAGGLAGGTPWMCLRMNAPRSTGDVRFG